MGDFGYGLKISHKADGEGDYTEFANVVNIPFPEVEADEHESTHLQSPDRFKEWVKGFKDAGDVTIDLRFTEAAYATALDLQDETENIAFQIEFPSGALIDFEGFVKTVGAQKQLHDVMALPVTLRVSGKPTFTPAV